MLKNAFILLVLSNVKHICTLNVSPISAAISSSIPQLSIISPASIYRDANSIIPPDGLGKGGPPGGYAVDAFSPIYAQVQVFPLADALRTSNTGLDIGSGTEQISVIIQRAIQ